MARKGRGGGRWFAPVPRRLRPSSRICGSPQLGAPSIIHSLRLKASFFPLLSSSAPASLSAARGSIPAPSRASPAPAAGPRTEPEEEAFSQGPNVFFREPNASDAYIRTYVRTYAFASPSFQIAREPRPDGRVCRPKRVGRTYVRTYVRVVRTGPPCVTQCVTRRCILPGVSIPGPAEVMVDPPGPRPGTPPGPRFARRPRS